MTISLSPAVTQVCLRKLALYGSSTLGNDIYYLKEFIDMLVSVFSEQKLVLELKKSDSENYKKLGREWFGSNGMKKRLEKLDKLIEETKTTYDLLEDKKMEKKNPSYDKFTARARKIPAIKRDLYDLFMFLVTNTSIQNKSIPSEYFKILEHRGSKPMFGMDKKRVMGVNPDGGY